MKRISVCGGKPLNGSVTIHSAKNALLPILAAAVMADSPVTLPECPPIKDVNVMLDILTQLGCRCERHEDRVVIDPSNIHNGEMCDLLAQQLRSSIFMLGPLVARLGYACLCYPGGCDIGIRPIDLHLMGLRTLGVKVCEENGHIFCSCDRLLGNAVYLDYPSVGATENIMMAAAVADGATVIKNAAKEPEIEELQRFLNAMGGRVSGAGTSTVVIHGVERLRGCEFKTMPDRIVTGTFMLAAAITGGDITITNAGGEHVRALFSKLERGGCVIEEDKCSMRIRAPERIKSAHMIETMPYPGFPTDLQSPMMALQSVADGACLLVENVFENRFKLAGELKRMGADITVKDRVAVIHGVKRLHGSSVTSLDLRSGAALVLAGLNAEGTTVIHDNDLISRGYYKFEEALRQLGADITVSEE